MIDTHCHLDKAEFDPDRDAVLLRARAAGVSDLVVPAVGPNGWGGLAAWAGSTPGAHFGLGIHPQLLPALDPGGDERRLAALDQALSRGGAVGVGECGLDAPTERTGPGPYSAPMDRQVAVLRGHLALARKHRLPALLHCLGAHARLLKVLSQAPPEFGGVLHSYSGSVEEVRAYADLGLFFSFAGPLTYERARRPKAAARAVPRDRIVLETDAPDQTPRPHRGRNEPAFLPDIAAGLSAALGIPASEVDSLTTANARALFRLR
ncbi:MAG TPA: TatD family hydrolase [Anaeromyxobacter sp.]|nr:TatD family hydrolase [Anaeromyxobacter sp.]